MCLNKKFIYLPNFTSNVPYFNVGYQDKLIKILNDKNLPKRHTSSTRLIDVDPDKKDLKSSIIC